METVQFGPREHGPTFGAGLGKLNNFNKNYILKSINLSEKVKIPY